MSDVLNTISWFLLLGTVCLMALRRLHVHHHYHYPDDGDDDGGEELGPPHREPRASADDRARFN